MFCVIYNVELCDVLFLCVANVIVWLVVLWCVTVSGVSVCVCVFSCVLFVRFVLLCLNLFVCDWLRCVV